MDMKLSVSPSQSGGNHDRVDSLTTGGRQVIIKHSIDHIHKVERCIRLERRVEFLQARVNRTQKDAWHDKGEASALRFALDCIYTCYPDLEVQVQEVAGKHLQWYESVTRSKLGEPNDGE
jgi:hypothetical protein